MSANTERIRRVLEFLENSRFNYSTAPAYAEPGYTDPEDGALIVFADWNDREHRDPITGYYERGTSKRDTIPSRSAKLLERLGCSIEWEDKWSTCDDCGRAFRTSPDSYCWRRSYAIIGECSLVCADCLRDDPTEYLEQCEGRQTAVTFDLPLRDYGYVPIERKLENGLHPGQADSPQAIAKILGQLGIDRFLFRLDCVGQFDVEFSVWLHKNEACKWERGVAKYRESDRREHPSPAERCEAFLRGIPK